MSAAITKSAATALARRQLSYGHQAHADGATARCPRCADAGRRVDVVLYADHRGRLVHGDMVRQLAAAIVDCATYGDHAS